MIFDYTELAAKQMTDVVYARAYTQVDGVDYYSDVNKYSILQYAYSKLGKTGTASTNAELKDMLSSMLTYGASAQKYFDHKENRLATADWYQVKVTAGALGDGCVQGLYLAGDKVTLTAPEENAEGLEFAYWKDSAGNKVSVSVNFELTVGSKNDTYTPVYEHTPVVDPAVAPTCTETGLTEGSHCGTCGITLVAQESVSALGHAEGDAVIENYVAPDCETAGSYDNMVYCSVCREELSRETVDIPPEHTPAEPAVENTVPVSCANAGSYENVVYCSVCRKELSRETVITSEPLDHKTYVTTTVPTTAIVYTKTNSSSYPFSVSGNQITSTNKIINSSSTYTITALYAFTLELQYNVSSESNYDKLIIKHNSTTKVTASGTTVTSFTSISIPMQSGDTVTITYSKDGSVDKGDDCAYVKIITGTTQTVQTEKTELVAITDSNRDSFANCAEAVLCDVCGQVAVDKLPHTEVVDAAVAPTCTAIGLTEGSHCEVCGEVVIAQETVAVLKHNFVDGYCTVCGEITSSEGLSFTYLSSTDSYEVSGIGSCTDTHIIIPLTHNGKQVTSIGSYAFSGRSNLTGVTIPDSVVEIKASAFSNCINLTNVDFGSGLKKIGSWAFSSCDNFKEIILPEGLLFIGEDSFSSGYKKSYVIIPNSVTEIYGEAFWYVCTVYCETGSKPSGWSSNWFLDYDTEGQVVWGYYSEYVIIDGLMYGLNGNNAALVKQPGTIPTNLIIPETIQYKGKTYTVKWIKDYAFSKKYLNSVVIPDTVVSIGKNAFEECYLRSITLSKNLISIGESAFAHNSYLSQIVIPSSVTSINQWAFADCANVTIYCEAISQPSGWNTNWNGWDYPVVWGYSG